MPRCVPNLTHRNTEVEFEHKEEGIHMATIRVKDISKLEDEGTLEALGYTYSISGGGYVSKDSATFIGVMRQPYIGEVQQFRRGAEEEHKKNVAELKQLDLLA